MPGRNAIAAMILTGALLTPMAGAYAFDETKYPDMQAQWARPTGVGIQWDPTKRIGPPRNRR